MDTIQRQVKNNRTINIGLASNIFLSIIKTTVGIMGHSTALLADGINSTSDVAYYIVVKIFMALSGKPADHEHPYGHRQFESIATLVVGSFVVTTSVAVFWNSISKMYDLLTRQGDFSVASVYAFWIAVFTICLKIVLSVFTKNVGDKTKNPAILALAFDHRNDVFASSAAAIGIFLGRAGYAWIDPFAGALVAILILRTGIGIMRESSLDLMDTVPGVSLVWQITEIVKGIPEIRKVEQIYAHRFGPYFVINITICIDGSLSVAKGDAVATQVEESIYENIDYVRQVYVHYHPA